MLVPATLKSDTAVFQALEEVDDQRGNFHGWWITMLPNDALEAVTQYLSMQDMDNLGKVCRKLQSSLMTCGLPIIRHYLSLPKHQQRFYQQMATGNRQLIDQVRKKLASGYIFPIQFSPAMCIPFTHSFRQRLISSTAISLEPRGCIEATSFDNHGFCFERKVLNKNFNRLILDNPKRCEITYWKADINGFWSSDHRFRYSKEDVPYLLFDPDLQLTDCSDTGDFIRDEGKSSQVVELSVADYLGRLSLDLSANNVFKLSDDRKTLLYLQSKNATIYDLEGDNHWHCKGRFATVQDALFCPDGLYIALVRADDVCFLKRSRSGSWISSGNINYVKPESDSYVHPFKAAVFSPDGCHILATCTHSRAGYEQRLPLAPDLLVNATIGSIDADGQWFTQNVIRKTIPKTFYHPLSKIGFTHDGKHIIVAGKTDFDAWRLSEDGQWIETVKNRCFADNPDRFVDINYDMQLSMDGGSMMINLMSHIVIWAVDSGGLWHRQMQKPSRYPYFAQLSPDGKSLVCSGNSGQTAIWLRDPFNNWHQQAAKIPHLSMARFNEQSCLLAGKMLYFNMDTILLLGLTPRQIWQEKCRLIVDGEISELGFSPCGRTMQATYCEEYKQTTTFWQIEPDENGDNPLS